MVKIVIHNGQRGILQKELWTFNIWHAIMRHRVVSRRRIQYNDIIAHAV